MKDKDYQIDELEKKIQEVKKDEIEFGKTFESILLKNSLRSLITQRLEQTRFGKNIYLNDPDLKVPKWYNRILHLFAIHYWMEYMDLSKFDCNRRICLICGCTEGTIMQRIYGGYQTCKDDLLDPRELIDYIRGLDE